MAGNQTEERVERSMVFQAWRTVAFLHWRVDTQVLARHLPHGLVPDTLDGSGWLGLTPFRVPRFSVLDLPAVPLVSSFNETNLRTYVRRPDGRDGLWFFSLDVDSVVNVGGGRLVEVPVEHEPWPLRDAELVACDETVLARLGSTCPTRPPWCTSPTAWTPDSVLPAWRDRRTRAARCAERTSVGGGRRPSSDQDRAGAAVTHDMYCLPLRAPARGVPSYRRVF